jgi:hypothetical protein
MRLPCVPLALAAGALIFLAGGSARACGFGAAGDCRRVSGELKSALFDGAEGAEAAAPAAAPAPVPTPLDTSVERLLDAGTYADVFRVLKDDNSCSRFFGGPARAVTAFNEFARRLRSGPLGAGNDVAIRMRGDYTTYHDSLTGASYRIFKEEMVNSNGPFLRRAPTPSTASARVGRFHALTRQARALTLLHELGHLLQGADGKWLLPNDGGDPALSERNTRTVESQCVGQLLALH